MEKRTIYTESGNRNKIDDRRDGMAFYSIRVKEFWCAALKKKVIVRQLAFPLLIFMPRKQ